MPQDIGAHAQQIAPGHQADDFVIIPSEDRLSAAHQRELRRVTPLLRGLLTQLARR